jgi:hypothetical protein
VEQTALCVGAASNTAISALTAGRGAKASGEVREHRQATRLQAQEPPAVDSKVGGMATESTTTASERMTELVEQRARANNRIREVENEQREAAEALMAARETVTEFHRTGGRPVDQKRLEGQLATAQGRFDEPWSVRIEGARRAARDAHELVQSFVAEHLDELLLSCGPAGEAAAERISNAAAELLAGFSDWSQAAQEMSALLSLVGQTQPGDVSASRCDAVAREVSRLIQEGGEVPPVVRRDPRPEQAVAPVVRAVA